MSKANLEKLLLRITSGANEEIRKNFNYNIHKYAVNADSVVDEVFQQIRGTTATIDIPKDIIKPLVYKYTSSIHARFKRYNPKAFKVRVVGRPDSFFVVLESISQTQSNVFDAIYKTRKQSLETLKDDLYDTVRDYLKTRRKYKAQQKLLFNRVYGFQDKDGEYRRGVLELGHTSGGSIIEQELLEHKIEFSETIRRLPVTQSEVVNKILASMNFSVDTNVRRAGRLRSGKIVVSIYDHGRKSNSAQGQEEKKLRKAFATVITKVLKETDFVGLETSPNVIDLITGYLQDEGRKAGFKGGNNTLIANSKKQYKATAKSSIKTRLLTTTINESLRNGLKTNFRTIDYQPNNTNWMSLINLINLYLPNKLKQNMQAPALVYRTGRFANSVKIVGVETTPQGFPSFVFDYMRSPYDVFDKARGARPWNTPERDPSTLIQKSIRDIARDLAIGKFYLRRLK